MIHKLDDPGRKFPLPSCRRAASVDQRSLKAWFPPWIGVVSRIALGIGLLYLALREVELEAVSGALYTLDTRWLILATGTSISALVLKIWRWGIVVEAILPGRSRLQVARSFLIGQTANMMLPLRSGDAARAISITPITDPKFGGILAGIVAEKALDLIALAAAAALIITLIPAGMLHGVWIWLSGLAVFGLAATTAVILSHKGIWPRIQSYLERLPGAWRARALMWVNSLIHGLKALYRCRRWRAVLALTGLVWLAMLLTNLALLKGLDMKASPAAGLLVLVFVHAGVSPGWMPGSLGPFYFFARLALDVLGYGPDGATAFAILLHAVAVLPTLLGTGMSLVLHGGRTTSLQSHGS
ncbi:MAG: lysylphosphatidylglycerol synthase transmembrane domain-containing protein [Anaerolineales bacterium]